MILAARASVLILISALGVRTIGFHRTKARIESVAPKGRRSSADCVQAIKRARSYGLFRGNCLSQSLALLWLLRRSGHAGAIRIGVKPAAAGMLAHAWVELDGQIIDPAAIADQYAAFSA